MDWVTQRVQHEGRVPRLSDVVEQAVKGFGYRDLRKTSIARQLRLHPYYHMNNLLNSMICYSTPYHKLNQHQIH